MASTLKIDTVTTPDGTGNITFSRPVTGNGGLGKILQVVNVVYTTESTTTNTFPLDTSIPQNTEGAELTTASITCSATSSKVLFFCSGELSSSAAGGHLMVALFKNSDANALHVQTGFRDDADYCSNYAFQYEDSPSSVSEQTYKLRYGSNTGTSRVNYVSSGRWGGLQAWRITLMEVGA
jgi:hypothetical protein